jgi:peptidoglycan/xylan/chitin deacetylase (PgdA/CDA1 family)
MVRDIQGYGTTPLFPPETILYENYPEKEEKVDFSQFNHGSRIRGREVALVFNVTESIEGLTLILNILSEYSINATFFINGEAIRRYPGAIKEIAESQHEVGSLFYMYFNMTDSRFILNSEFIKQGMARTEDDYFNATEEEISLLWHAPYYFVNSDIIAASKEMNYTYVGRDVDSMDWVTKSTTTVAAGVYMPSAKLLERILEKKKPGSVIPILVGIPSGERDDYLFQKLDLLIDELLDRGYQIVTVSNLIENAK